MCLRTAHYLAGFATGAALALHAHQSAWVAVTSACLAAVTAGGVLSHWWGIPAAVAVWLYVSGGPWWAWMLLAGWVSHLAADWAFGKRAWGRGPGIPFLPWWAHHGLGGDAGGLLERFVLVPVLAVLGPAVLAWPHLGPLVRTATTAWEATR
jgi:hypothetical protein